MHTKKAIVIGSGVAGMATAIRLAVQGFNVTVYEANNYPGGKLNAFEKEGYHFDTGPSLFTQPQNIEELFELAGETIQNYLSYEKVDIACRYFYENGKIINAYTDVNAFADELATQLNEDREAVKKYLDRSEKTYKNIGTVFTDNSLHKKRTWFNKRIAKALATVRFPYLFRSLNEYNSKQFRSAEATQLFNRFATYNGSDPYRAPAMLSLIPHLEQNEGVFYPRRGMVSITKALFELAKKKGVQFYFDAPVQRIIQHEGCIRGVVVNEENIAADIVVSNADIYLTYKKLLKEEFKAKKILKQERSSSAVIFYWGMKKKFPQLDLHNIFFSKDYKKEFSNIFKQKKITNDPTVYVNITSKVESSQAPAGKENWFVMVNAPSNIGQDWAVIKEELRKNVISKINSILQDDIEPLIEMETFLDPVLIETQTASYMGSLYGSSSNSKMSAFLRQANFSNTIAGLYFCGGSVHPGGGIPLCLKSAKIVADLIEKNKNKLKH